MWWAIREYYLTFPFQVRMPVGLFLLFVFKITFQSEAHT
jgi:hypothetical protein